MSRGSLGVEGRPSGWRVAAADKSSCLLVVEPASASGSMSVGEAAPAAPRSLDEPWPTGGQEWILCTDFRSALSRLGHARTEEQSPVAEWKHPLGPERLAEWPRVTSEMFIVTIAQIPRRSCFFCCTRRPCRPQQLGAASVWKHEQERGVDVLTQQRGSPTD